MQYMNTNKLNTVYFDEFELSVEFVLLFHVVVMLNYCSNSTDTSVFQTMTEDVGQLFIFLKIHVIVKH